MQFDAFCGVFWRRGLICINSSTVAIISHCGIWYIVWSLRKTYLVACDDRVFLLVSDVSQADVWLLCKAALLPHTAAEPNGKLMAAVCTYTMHYNHNQLGVHATRLQSQWYMCQYLLQFRLFIRVKLIQVECSRSFVQAQIHVILVPLRIWWKLWNTSIFLPNFTPLSR